jgi:hypothetical protein
LQELIDLLEFCAQSASLNAELVALAIGFRVKISDATFVVTSHIVDEILSLLHPANIMLQSTSTDLSKGVELISATKAQILALRCEEAFDKIWSKSSTAVDEDVTHPPKRCKPNSKYNDCVILESTGQNSRSTQFKQSKKQSLKQLFYQLIDATLQEMNRRFSEMSSSLMKGSDALMPCSDHFLELSSVSIISELLPGIDRDQLACELKVAKPFILQKCQGNDLRLDLQACLDIIRPVRDGFPLLYR